MLKADKLQYLSIVRNYYKVRTYKELANVLKLPYTDKIALFDFIIELASDCNYRRLPWKLVLSKDRTTMKTYLNLMGDMILFETTEGVHVIIAYILNELVDKERLVFYNENFEAYDKDVKLIARGKGVCSLAIDYLQQEIADLIGFTTKDSTTFRIQSGECIRLKKSTKSYRMEGIDNIPSISFGLVANDHYILNVIGFKDGPIVFKYKDYSFKVENATATYSVLNKYDTMIPANSQWIEYCGMTCLGFKCALYDTNFRVYSVKKKMLMRFIPEEETYIDPEMETVNLRINGTDFTWNVNQYVPFIAEPEIDIYEGVINEDGEGFPNTVFSVVSDPGKYVKVGKKLSKRSEVYSFLRSTGCVIGEYLQGEPEDDLERWQAVARKESRIGKAVVTRRDRQKGFKVRMELFAALCNGNNMFAEINNYARNYSGDRVPFDAIQDAVYYAIRVLIKENPSVELQLLTVDAPRIGAYEALRHEAGQEKLDDVTLHDYWKESHSLVSSPSILKYLYKHKQEQGIQKLYDALKVTYVGEGKCLRVAP